MEVLKRPLITEKIAVLNEKGVYGFLVDLKANKIEIAKAVKDMYNVTVVNVRTVRYAGKPKTRMTKSRMTTGRTAAYKKAIVQIAEGEIIDFYGNI
jgi:large subunit ribosomal protein L23